jgi:DNA-3-methyladenine glycosylase I
MHRCAWTKDNSYNNEYHDAEWGVPVHDDTKLFEFLVLDAFQAGLSWLTMLKKRENFRKVFDKFDFNKIALYNSQKVEELMLDSDIVRNRGKIEATITNAQRYIEIRKEFGSFDKYIWQFTGGKTIINIHKSISEIPAQSPESEKMSKDLQKRGFKFVGPTICYAFMQAAGMINDHEISCFRYKEINKIISEQ